MKQILSLLLAALLLGSLAACQTPPAQQPVETGDTADSDTIASAEDTTAPAAPAPVNPADVENFAVLADDGSVSVKTVAIPTNRFRILTPVSEMTYDDGHLLVLLWNEDEAGAVSDLQIAVVDMEKAELTFSTVPLESDVVPETVYRSPDELYLIAHDYSDPENVRAVGWAVSGQWYQLSVLPLSEDEAKNLVFAHDANIVSTEDGTWTAWQRTTADAKKDGLYIKNAAGGFIPLKEAISLEEVPEDWDGQEIGAVRGYIPVGFIDDVTLVYQITGWEWHWGYGFYDVSADEFREVENGRTVLAVGDGFLYTADMTGYAYKTVYKEFPDGTEEIVAAAEGNQNEALAPFFTTEFLVSLHYSDELCAFLYPADDSIPAETDTLQLTVMDADLTEVRFSAYLEQEENTLPFWVWYENSLLLFRAGGEK